MGLPTVGLPPQLINHSPPTLAFAANVILLSPTALRKIVGKKDCPLQCHSILLSHVDTTPSSVMITPTLSSEFTAYYAPQTALNKVYIFKTV